MPDSPSLSICGAVERAACLGPVELHSLVRAAAHGCDLSLRGSGQRIENPLHQGEELPPRCVVS
jgi:hypothetical protein